MCNRPPSPASSTLSNAKASPCASSPTHDRRFAFVEPTPEGRALVDTIRRSRDAYLARRLRTFSRRGPRAARTGRGPPRTADRGPRAMTRAGRLGRATFSSLKNRNYRLYFIGQIISVSGTWMQRLAQAWLILRLTHNNGFALGIESGLQFLPMLLFGAWGGVIADRFDKRRMLYLTQIVAGVLALGLGVIVAVGAATVAARLRLLRAARLRERDRQSGPPDLRDGDGRARRAAQRGRPEQRRDEQLARRRPGGGRHRHRKPSASRRASSSTPRRTSPCCSPSG